MANCGELCTVWRCAWSCAWCPKPAASNCLLRVVMHSAHSPSAQCNPTCALLCFAFAVIAPLTTLGHWQREIETWTDMNCVVYAGGQEDRRIIEVRGNALAVLRPVLILVCATHCRCHSTTHSSFRPPAEVRPVLRPGRPRPHRQAQRGAGVVRNSAERARPVPGVFAVYIAMRCCPFFLAIHCIAVPA